MPAAVLALIQAAATLEPLIASALPAIEKAFNGESLTDADLATLDTSTQALNAKVAALEAAAEGNPPPATA